MPVPAGSRHRDSASRAARDCEKSAGGIALDHGVAGQIPLWPSHLSVLRAAQASRFTSRPRHPHQWAAKKSPPVNFPVIGVAKTVSFRITFSEKSRSILREEREWPRLKSRSRMILERA